MISQYIWLNLLLFTLFYSVTRVSGFINTLPDWNTNDVAELPKRPKIPSRCIPTIEFSSVRNKKNYGPQYLGEKPLKNFAQWDYLITKGNATNDDRIIINAVSENEGKMDTLQAYDNQAVTVGAMQKTINPAGTGEFPIQVFEFKSTQPLLYEILFEDNGWQVQKIKNEIYMSYNGLTGRGLVTMLRANFTKPKVKNTSEALGALVCAARHPLFQMKQVTDFIRRLHKEVLPIVPTGFKPYNLSDYLQSNFGKALVLDQHVNRKNYVKTDFGQALEHVLKEHKGLSKNPAEWGSKRAEYERKVLTQYGKIRRTTDPQGRLKRLEAIFGK